MLAGWGIQWQGTQEDVHDEPDSVLGRRDSH